MVRDKTCYRDLFIATFQLSCFTAGGGFVIRPLMCQKFIEEKGRIDTDGMMDLASIALPAPGSIAVDASILSGYRPGGQGRE